MEARTEPLTITPRVVNMASGALRINNPPSHEAMPPGQEQAERQRKRPLRTRRIARAVSNQLARNRDHDGQRAAGGWTKKIYVPSRGPDDWRQLLADPSTQWETGYSAKALAYCWEAADGLPGGLPKEIANVLRTADNGPTLLLALPEHKVQLPGSALGASQNDIFALIRVGTRTVAATIEGKVDEPFGHCNSVTGWSMPHRASASGLLTCARSSDSKSARFLLTSTISSCTELLLP